jgi:hypothetical protein
MPIVMPIVTVFEKAHELEFSVRFCERSCSLPMGWV